MMVFKQCHVIWRPSTINFISINNLKTSTMSYRLKDEILRNFTAQKVLKINI